MAPNSRPPLTSRIRASFEGKRSQSSDGKHAPANGIVAVDSETLRKVIDAAINSEVFQIAIAANLAKIIKPSIKSALDTIQPVIETVYQHDMLLRKTNASVENLLLHFDTNTEKLPRASRDDGAEREREAAEDVADSEETPVKAELEGGAAMPNDTSTVDDHNVEQSKSIPLEYNGERVAKKVSELSAAIDVNTKMLTDLMTGIEDIRATVPTKEHISSLKSISEQSTTATSVMQAQLDQLQADVAAIITAVGTDLGANVMALQKSVQGQDTSILETHTTKLNSLSADLNSHFARLDMLQSISENVHDLQTQVGNIKLQVGTVLSVVETHGTQSSGEQAKILVAVKESHSMHASHTAALSEIKSSNLVLPSASAPLSLSEDHSETAHALEALIADLASLRQNINVRLDTNGTNFSTLGTKIDTVLDIVEAIKDGDNSAQILEGIHQSNDFHAAHAAVLDGINERSLSAEAPVGGHIETLEPHLESIVKTLDLHTATLATIPSTGSKPADSESLEQKLDGMMALLNEIRDSDVSAEILTAIHSCTDLVVEIKDGDVSDEILTALHESNEGHANHTAALTDIKAYSKEGLNTHARHTEALEGIKASGGIRSLDGESGVDEKMGSLITILEDHSTTLAEVKEAVYKGNENHASHTVALNEIRGHGAVLAGINDAQTSHAAALKDIKSQPTESTPPPAPVDLSGLESQLDVIIDNLDSQKLGLSDLKAASASASSSQLTSSELLETVNNNHSELLDNLASLKSIVKESNEGITAHGDSLRVLHDDAKVSHIGLSDAIKSLAIGGLGGAGAQTLSSHDKADNTDVLSAIHAVEMAIMEVSEKLDGVKGDIEESEITLKGLVKDAANEIKAEVDASGTEVKDDIHRMSGDVRALKITDVKSAVEESRRDVKNAIEILGEQVKNTGSKVVDLSEVLEGRSLNSGGDERQNSEALLSGLGEEGNWMKRPSRIKSGNEASRLPEIVAGEKMNKEIPLLPAPITEQEEPMSTPMKELQKEATPVPERDDSHPSMPIASPTSADKNASGAEKQDAESASTSAIASPISPDLATERKESKKSGKKGKKGKEAFVFDPETEDDGWDGEKDVVAT